MSILSIVLTGFGLAMDAFAVSVAKGITLTRVKAKDALKAFNRMGSWEIFCRLYKSL